MQILSSRLNYWREILPKSFVLGIKRDVIIITLDIHRKLGHLWDYHCCRCLAPSVDWRQQLSPIFCTPCYH